VARQQQRQHAADRAGAQNGDVVGRLGHDRILPSTTIAGVRRPLAFRHEIIAVPDMSSAPSAASASSPSRPRSKVALGLLACLFGWLGAHWWYLGRRHAWLVTLAAVACLAAATQFPVWYDNPAFFLVFIPMIDGFIEGVVFSLMPDEKFDRLYNPGRGRVTHTGWGPVLVAILGTLVGAIAGMFAIAMVVVYTWTALGWLDGYVF